jgi:ABC-2 type transport system permease protein
LKDIFWLVKNVFKILLKKKFSFLIIVGLPIVGVILSFLMYGSSDRTELRVGIVNNDSGELSRDVVSFIKSQEHVKVSGIKNAEVNDRVAGGKLDCVVIIDRGFSQSAMSGNPDPVRIISIKGEAVTSYIKSYLNNYIGDIAAFGRLAGNNQDKFHQLYEDYQRSTFKVHSVSLQDTSKYQNMTYQTIGYLVMFMLFAAVNLSNMMTKEKEKRTYFRILSAPVTAKAYVLSNILSNLIIMVIQILVTLTVMTKIFHINIGFPFWEMFGVLTLFALIAIGLSLAIVALADSSAAAGAFENLVVVPTCLISGCFFPADIMPEVLQKIADFTPQRWLLDTITKLQQGEAFSHLYVNYLILIAFAAVFFLIAVYKIARQNDVRNFV